jgi:signal transduction histidine kinase
MSIVLILTLGFLYYRVGARSDALAAIGLISFAGAAQFLPAMVGGIYWRSATERGAVVGLVAGFVAWAYTLFLPSMIRVGGATQGLLTEGPFGLRWLRPEALFHLEGWDPLVHALFWSLALNVSCYIFVSLFSDQKPLERLQSALFVDALGRLPREALRGWTGDTAVEDLMALARRIIGSERAHRAFREYADGERRKIHELVADNKLISFVERQLAGSIGAASARVLVSRIAGGETISLDEVITILDETQQAIEHGRQLEQKSSELEAIAAQLRHANAQLKEIDVMKDDFLSRVSHELRTPMTSIRSFTEVLLENSDINESQRRRFIEVIFDESKRLTRLLDEILDLSRLENGEQVLQLAPIDPLPIVEGAVGAMLGFALQRDVQLSTDLPPVSGEVIGDADRLKQAFINLIHNAVKFSGERNPAVRIGVTIEHDQFIFFVSDNGPGISEADQARIFEKFSRQGGATEGSGLGLAICRQIVEGHEGRIEVRSERGRGATFLIRLPFHVPAAKVQVAAE